MSSTVSDSVPARAAPARRVYITADAGTVKSRAAQPAAARLQASLIGLAPALSATAAPPASALARFNPANRKKRPDACKPAEPSLRAPRAGLWCNWQHVRF